MTPGPGPAPAARRPPAWLPLVGLSLLCAGVPALSGCEDAAPSTRTAASPSNPAPEPPRGPVWFVDRARDFGMDVVTRCGTPEKTSVLDSIGTGVALFDADGDGDLDVFVAPGSEVRGGKVVSAGGPWLFRNDGPGRWADVSKPSGLRYTGWAQGAAVCDFDGDGDLDLFVPHHGQDVLWRNKGDGTFEDVTKSAGLSGEDEWGVSATWGDYDGDGRPDLYVTNYLVVDALRPPDLSRYYGGPTMVFRGPDLLEGQPDRLWRNRGDGTFEDVTKSAGLPSPQGKGMSALFADLDGDGILDLFVTNDGQANELFRGLGRGRFREEAAEAGAAYSDKGLAEAGMAIALADLDGDGRLDLARTNFHHQGTRLIRNADGLSYVDVSQCSGMTALTYRLVGWGLVAEDFDDDGRPDLFQANGHVFPKGPADPYHQPPLLVRNINGDRFEDMTRSWGRDLDSLRSGRAVASGDLDGDGDVDLVMTTIDGPLRVLINEGKRSSHGVTVRLAGDRPNREAVGARVEVHARGRVHVGAVCRGGSILAASDSALHFGLGEARAIDRIRVVWPDGSDVTYPGAGLPVDARLTVSQGSGQVEVRPYAPVPDGVPR